MNFYKSNRYTLYLNHCKFPSNIKEWNLKYLTIQGGQLNLLPEMPESLYELTIIESEIVTNINIPETISSLTFINVIIHPDIFYNILENLKYKLESLFIKNIKINNLPVLPDSLKYLQCINCGLSNIQYLPNNLNSFNCSVNNLTEIPNLNKNKKLIFMNCSNNYLTKLPFLPDNIEYLNCNNNKISYIPNIPKKIIRFDCQENNLIYIPDINDEHLQYLHDLDRNTDHNIRININISKNPLCKIIGSEKDIIIIDHRYQMEGVLELTHNLNIEYDKIKKIKTLNKFRYNYYCLKLKKKFRDILWKNIREPKIIKKYSPQNLLLFLSNNETDEDIYELLENW